MSGARVALAHETGQGAALDLAGNALALIGAHPEQGDASSAMSTGAALA